MEATFDFCDEEEEEKEKEKERVKVMEEEEEEEQEEQQQQMEEDNWYSSINRSMDIPVDKQEWDENELEMQHQQMQRQQHRYQLHQQQQQKQRSEQLYRDWLVENFKEEFDQYEHEGGMPQEQFKQMMEQHNGAGRKRKLQQLFNRLDIDANMRVSWQEFYEGLTYKRKCEVNKSRRVTNKIVKKLVPAAKRKLRETKNAAANDGEPIPEETYLEAYNCKPPPIFIPLIFIICWCCFAAYAVELNRGSEWNRVTWDGGMPFYSPLVFCPSIRQQVWRYVTYLLLHNGYQHIVFNTILGCLLGIPLEIVHKAWRVGPVFLIGALAGSLASSVADPGTTLVGASGGVYSLIGAHYALVLMNWEELQKDWLKCKHNPLNLLMSGVMRLVYLTLFVGFDFGLAAYRRYATAALVHVSAAAHIGGIVAGLLIGTPVLRNIDKKPWEGKLAIISIIVSVILLGLGIAWNVFYTGFPTPKSLPCSNTGLLA